MARIKRSKTDTRYFKDIPKVDKMIHDKFCIYYRHCFHFSHRSKTCRDEYEAYGYCGKRPNINEEMKDRKMGDF